MKVDTRKLKQLLQDLNQQAIELDVGTDIDIYDKLQVITV